MWLPSERVIETMDEGKKNYNIGGGSDWWYNADNCFSKLTLYVA